MNVFKRLIRQLSRKAREHRYMELMGRIETLTEAEREEFAQLMNQLEAEDVAAG